MQARCFRLDHEAKVGLAKLEEDRDEVSEAWLGLGMSSTLSSVVGACCEREEEFSRAAAGLCRAREQCMTRGFWVAAIKKPTG